MRPRRRSFIRKAAALTAAALAAGPALADTYPNRPERIVVGYAPGGSTDILARRLGQWLSERLGQPFIVENRAGAGSNVGTEVVVNAPADGYTLLLVTPANFINAALYPSMRFNFVRDIAPVALMTLEPNAMIVHPSVPAKTLPEFIGYAKANPGKITMASGGNGASSHISGEMFKMLAGVDLVHVPHRGAGPALAAVLGAQAQVYFSPLSAAISYVRQGQLRALAVTTEKRSTLLPEAPAIAEFVRGYEAGQLYGVGVPRNTSADVINRLNREINATLADPAALSRLAELGMTPLGGTPAQFGKVIVEETEKWGKVVRFSGATID
jgi:tripartite-type tricarboxylate transporter receptor subunit TctC